MKVNELILKERRRKKLTQKSLSKKLGFSCPQVISNIERKKVWVGIELSKKFCNALSIDKNRMLRALKKDIEIRFK